MPSKQRQVDTGLWKRIQDRVPDVTITDVHRALLVRDYGGELTDDDWRHDAATIVHGLRTIDRELARYAGTRESHVRRAGTRVPATGWQRRAVLEQEALADQAQADPRIQAYRRQYVPAWPLTTDQAIAFLQTQGVPRTRPRIEPGGFLPTRPLPTIVCGPPVTDQYLLVQHAPLAHLALELQIEWGWSLDGAVWFVLLDHIVPFRAPLEVRWEVTHRGESRILVSALDYVPTSAITATIARAKQAHPLRVRLRRQALTARSTALLRFLDQHPTDQSYRTLMQCWNRECARAWRYDTPRNFWRDVQRARQQLSVSKRLATRR